LAQLLGQLGFFSLGGWLRQADQILCADIEPLPFGSSSVVHYGTCCWL
jgi:hypothetical protein